MAFVPLGVTTSFATMKGTVRDLVRAESAQESGIIEPALNNICYDAIVQVRSVLGRLLDKFFETNKTVTESSNVIDISTLDVSDPFSMVLYDSTIGRIPIVTSSMFQTYKTIYSATSLASAAFARVVNPESGGIMSGLSLETYRGSSVLTPGTLTLTYSRNPVRPATDSSKVDLPEPYIPLATRIAALMCFQKLKKDAPPDIASAVASSLNGFVAQLGLQVTPR